MVLKLNKLFSSKASKRAIVLMGGGARGLAHIGVLEVLEKNGWVPDLIVGTSMGAIVGGFYACNISTDEMKKMAQDPWLSDYFERPQIPFLARRANNFFDYFMLENYKTKLLRKIGFSQTDKIEEYLKSVVGEVLIEELTIPFACNALDLISGREVVFTEGKLYQAIRSSMSLPLVFEPVQFNHRILVDGGLIDNAPVEIGRNLGTDLIMLVDIHKPIQDIDTQKIKNTFQLLQRTAETVLANYNEQKIKKADFVLRVELETALLDFSNPSGIIDKGKNAALQNLKSIKDFFS